ncbi:MAG: enoyl-CoA hydratase [Mycobacteriales bacterium]
MAADSTYANLLVSLEAGVATVTLNRADAMNALNMGLKADLAGAVSALADDPDVRCVVLTGAGRAFSAGGDIGEMTLNDNPVRSRARLQALLRDLFIPLAEMEKPTIAAVNGHAHGAGLSLAIACDLVVAAESAVMSCAFSKLGLLPDCGSLYFLPRRVPMSVAKELIFTGRRFSATEGREMGLVNRVVPPEQLGEVVRELAGELAAGPTVAFGLAKRMLDQSLQTSLHEMAALEAFGQAVLYTTSDHLAAREAFSKRLSPAFLGR